MYKEILAENISLHRIEAKHYEALHPEEFNYFEQNKTFSDLRYIKERLRKNALALDLGCGTGNILLKLLDLGIESWGVDISKDMLAVLEKRIPVRHKKTTRLFCQNIDNFLVDCRQEFDLVSINSVLHHLPDYLKTLSRAIGLLRKGGWLYIRHEPTKNVLARDRFLRKILWQLDNIAYLILKIGRIPRISGKRNYRISDYQLYHGFDENSVLAQCRHAGFEIIKFKRYASCMRLGFSCWVDTNLLQSKTQFCLIARKV